MSIQVRKKQEKEESNSFSMEIAMPDLRQKSTAIKIDTKSSMEKVKEKKMEKKKPEKKLFYELLEETWNEKILNRGHTGTESPDNEECYYCPICCVCELLEIIPKIRKSNQMSVRNPYTHEEMVNLLRDKCKFIDNPVSLTPGINADGWTNKDYAFSERDEPMLAFNLASSLAGQMNNLKIAHAIKDQLYDNKEPKQLPKEDPYRALGNEDLFEVRPIYGYATRHGILTRKMNTMTLPGLGIKDLELENDDKD